MVEILQQCFTKNIKRNIIWYSFKIEPTIDGMSGE